MSFKKALRKISTQDAETNRFQDNVSQAIQPLLNFPISDGVLVQGISLNSSTFTQVSHKLGRPYRGWLVVRKSANAQIWENFQETNLLDRFLPLRASASVIVDLWIF
jgi:hypothetical protein